MRLAFSRSEDCRRLCVVRPGTSQRAQVPSCWLAGCFSSWCCGCIGSVRRWLLSRWKHKKKEPADAGPPEEHQLDQQLQLLVWVG